MTNYEALKANLKTMSNEMMKLEKQLLESEAEAAGLKLFIGIVGIAAVIENIAWFAMWAWI